MPRRLSPLPLACLCSTALALLWLAAGPVRAQDAKEDPKKDRKVILPSDGEAAFKSAKFKAAKQRFEVINKSAEGEKANKDSKEDQEAVDWMAQYYTYRLTWEQLTTPPDVSGPKPPEGTANKLVEDFFAQVSSATSPAMRQANPAFSEMYVRALALRARDVIQTRQPIAAVNGARMLARLAEVGSVEAGDACAEAVEDAKDFLAPKARAGVQYWAFQGLKSLLALWAEAPAGAEGPPATRKDREARYVQALVEAIPRKPPDGTKPLTREELNGLRVFRREAVRALAQYRAPAVADDKGAVKVGTALALLKVVNDDGLAPSVRLDEQIEAAVGVARVRSKALASYQPDYAAQQIGYLVVVMASQAAIKDPPKFAWKVHAARLADAVEAMRADVKDHPDKAAVAYVEKVLGPAQRILKELEATERASGVDLKAWLGSNPPPNKTLYKGVDGSTVRPLEKGEDAPAEVEKKPDEKKPGEKKP